MRRIPITGGSLRLCDAANVGFETGLGESVRWYLGRKDSWCHTGGPRKACVYKNYGFRIAV
jgi:hypothetical protein